MNQVLLRKECFGGTLFNPKTGKRCYINQREFEEILKGVFPQDLKDFSSSVKVVTPSFIPEYNFSAPDKVFFEITRRCNLTCIQCLNSSGQSLLDELTLEYQLKIIDDLANSGVQEIRFTGGEPLTDRNWRNLFQQCKDHGLHLSVGSNATLMTREVIQDMANIGVNSVITSLDGLKATHEMIRGLNSWDKTLNAIHFLKEFGIDVRVNFVLMRNNLHEVYDLSEQLLKEDIPVFIRRYIPSGRAAGNFEHILTKDEYSTLEQSLEPLILQYGSKLRGHYINEGHVKTRIQLPFQRKTCSAAHRGMVILPNGKLSTCGFLAALGEGVGNLKKSSFAEIWKQMIEAQYIQQLESKLPHFNQKNPGPATNCLALAMSQN